MKSRPGSTTNDMLRANPASLRCSTGWRTPSRSSMYSSVVTSMSVSVYSECSEYLGEHRYTEHSEYTDTDIEVTTDEYIEDLDGVRHPVLQRKDAGFARNMSFVVDPGRLFMMGDNRDNSADSRVEGGIGQIPFSYVKGRASIIWISFGGRAGIRFERIFRAVH